METYTMSYDINVWRVIKKGNLPVPPRKDENCQVIVSTDLLDLDDYTDDGKKYEKISSCETAKETWDKLEVTYEGTNKVKEIRINLLVREYELFQMKVGESAVGMFSRFSKILRDLKSFGKTIKSGEQLRKILRCLPTVWQPKANSTKKKKIVAFKATVAEPEDEEAEEGGEQDENIVMLSQVVTSMMMKNKNSTRDIERVLNELRNIQREKKYWALKLEVYDIEHDMLQEEVNELQLQLNRLQKFTRTKSKQKEALKIPEIHRVFIVENMVTPLIVAVTKLDGGTITFGDKSKGNIIRVGKAFLSSTCDVDEVDLVDELSYNLLSISQLCDNDYEVRFKKHVWFIKDESGKVILSGNRDRNVYTISNIDSLSDQICLTSMVDDPWMWHRKLGHASMHTIQKLSKHDLVIGLPKLYFFKRLYL
ncbi:uncharacterized protein [Nicotiana sylvestris]|uniref:uncharacterized protein n=1 Tax=Nicotiana sylvestris TaxID=4096 RepID=UPI00388CC41D